MASALAGPRFDVPLGHPEHDVGPCIVRALASKGFAVVATETSSDFGGEVLQDIKAIEGAERLTQPPKLLAEGLLGEKGAARTCELSSPEVEPQEWEGSAVRFSDGLISQMGELLAPLVGDLGVTLVGRTPGLLIETGEAPSDDPPELTDREASMWLSTFARAKLLMLHFLGPHWGSLELRVIGEEDMDPYSLAAGPGMMIILRADTLLQEYTSAEPSYVISSYACGEKLHWYKKQTGESLHPAAAAIDKFVVDRMLSVRRDAIDHADEAALEPAMPRSMQRLMNRMFVKGERAAVKGTSAKFANVRDIEQFHKSMTACIDYAQEVPHSRWDHTEHYHPDLEGYHWGKVYCMHMTYAPDLDMFDNKFFLISPSEASKMDPAERQILEVGYEGLARAGLKKRDLMGSDCGIYVAWQSDTPVGSEDRGMGANRASFCLGMKGPSLACDVDHASSLLALKVACNELGRACQQGIAVGCHINQSIQSWIVHCGAHLLSPAGRTCTFDSNASGFIRADTIASAYVKRLPTDADDVWDTKGPLDGVIVAATCKNQGRTASLRSLSGPCVQECFDEGLRQAKISPLDVDIIECSGRADLMQDGIEVSSIARVFRPTKESSTQDEALLLGAGKANVGNSWPASGLVSILKALAAGLFGCVVPLVHFNQANPLIMAEITEKPVIIPSECVDTQSEMGYSSVLAYGWGGTNAHIMVWNRVDKQRIDMGRPDTLEKPVYWPGGGGMLGLDQVPSRSYTIVGTWSSWENPVQMEKEDEGVFGCTVTLGENCWEMFQIWLDGDEDRVLHPGRPKAPKCTSVTGPERAGVQMNWLIDGRAMLMPEEEAAAELQDGSAPDADPGIGTLVLQPYVGKGGADGLVELPHGDRGWPGAEYRVRLRVAGKWRTVDWERISDMPATPLMDSQSPEVKGKYFITGSFNDWGFQEMAPDYVATGVYNAEVLLLRARERFQIIRNQDWQQMIYPLDRIAADSYAEVGGPDDQGHGFQWQIRGEAGDVFRVEFQRSVEDSGFQSMRVSWRRVRSEPIGKQRLEEARRTKFFLMGSWDGFKSKCEMKWDGRHYLGEVATGASGRESFQILMNGDRGAVLHPSMPDATPSTSHSLLGPSDYSPEECWTVGEAPKEDAGAQAPQEYEIRLVIAKSGQPIAVQWAKK